MEDDESDECYESGPFCPHWADSGSCLELCAKCTHSCAEHWNGECDACDCMCFEDSV